MEPGHEVIKIGDAEAEHFYVIEEGEFDCFAMVKGQLQKVTEYINRGSFGELALMYNQPRMATVTARTPGKLWALVSLDNLKSTPQSLTFFVRRTAKLSRGSSCAELMKNGSYICL